MRTKLYYSIFLFYFSFHNVLSTIYYPTVFWTFLNCRFNLNRELNISSDRRGYYFKVKRDSHMFFICPNTALWSDVTEPPGLHSERMYENLIMVDEASYKSCSITNESKPYHNIQLMRCDQRPISTTLQYTRETFSKYQAIDDKIKYFPGDDYYFISTSDGTLTSLDNQNGGHCESHNMKLHIHVCEETEKCDFETPVCPPELVQHDEKPRVIMLDNPFPGDDLEPPPSDDFNQTTVKPDIEAGSKPTSSKLLSESSHLMIHAGAGLLIIILLVLLAFVYCSKRKLSRQRKNLEGDGILVDDLKRGNNHNVDL